MRGDPQAAMDALSDRLLNDPDSTIQRAAIAALFERFQEEAGPHFLKALTTSKDPNIRYFASSYLRAGKTVDPKMVPTLLTLANHDEDGNVRSHAAEAVVKAGETAIPAMVELVSSPHG